MSTAITMDTVFAQAQSLTLRERLELAERLWHEGHDTETSAGTSETDVNEADVLAEVHRRISDDRAGRTQCVPGDMALRKVRESVLGCA
ncbi:MAG: addiction module protein [Roseimicrobium sp.]